MGILGQTVFIRRASPGEIDMVDLADEAPESSGSNIDLVSVIRTASSVDVETSQNFTNGLVRA